MMRSYSTPEIRLFAPDSQDLLTGSTPIGFQFEEGENHGGIGDEVDF